MKIHKILFLVLTIPLLVFASSHKFYVSITNIEHNEKQKSLQITTRIFIDDFQRLLKERYDFQEELTSEKKPKEVEQMMQKYLNKKLKISINSEFKPFNFIGKKYEDDVVVCYLEIEAINSVNTIEIENYILYEIEDDQQNLVHVKDKNKRKSLLLVKENDKGLLKF